MYKPNDPDHTRFTMLYCDHPTCLVNTFEHGRDGACPACGSPGLLVVRR